MPDQIAKKLQKGEVLTFCFILPHNSPIWETFSAHWLKKILPTRTSGRLAGDGARKH